MPRSTKTKRSAARASRRASGKAFFRAMNSARTRAVMAPEQPATAASEFRGFAIHKSDGPKGRVAVAAQLFQTGDVVLREVAWIVGSWEEGAGGVDASTLSPEYWPGVTADEFEAGENALADIDGVDELDKARCLLECCARWRAGKTAYAPIKRLTASNVPLCAAAVAAMRADADVSLLVPAEMPDVLLVHTLGALNANSHTLEDLGGCGVFPMAAMMEHSCQPNCTFATEGSTLTVHATERIDAGEPLSIDYGNAPMDPAADRQAALKAGYGFDCACDKCTGVDQCRAFQCPACSGRVCPRYAGAWQCLDCGRLVDKHEKRRFEDDENAVKRMTAPTVIEAVDLVVAAGTLHKGHYLVYRMLDALARGGAARVATMAPGEARQVVLHWARVLETLELQVTGYHHEKMLAYDMMAQCAVAAGERRVAQSAWGHAFSQARVCVGRRARMTRNFFALSMAPPATVGELAARLGQGAERVAEAIRDEA